MRVKDDLFRIRSLRFDYIPLWNMSKCNLFDHSRYPYFGILNNFVKRKSILR